MTDETPTPLWALPAKWREVEELVAEAKQWFDAAGPLTKVRLWLIGTLQSSIGAPPLDPYAIGFGDGLLQAADELESALNAFDVDAAARELYHGVVAPHGHADDTECPALATIAAALRAAAAAAWQTCPETGEPHQWGLAFDDIYACGNCGVEDRAIAPAGPEEG